MRRIVSNTGPVLHLHEAGALQLLDLTGEVSIPPAVDDELSHLIPSWETVRPTWLSRKELTDEAQKEALGWPAVGVLGLGEAEALSLARLLGAQWFVPDDTAARVVASRIGIEVHGSLGIILWVAAVGRVDRDEARRNLNRLFRSSLWVSPRLRSEALAALDEVFT